MVVHLLKCEDTLLLFPQVLLRVKESEIQYLKQEISSLKDELQTALRVMLEKFLQNLLEGLCVCAWISAPLYLDLKQHPVSPLKRTSVSAVKHSTALSLG